MGERAIREEVIAALAEALHEQPDRIQGFLYGDAHVIRDVYLPPGQQELWRRVGPYEETHEAMMRQCRAEQMRLAVEAVAKQFADRARLGEVLALPAGYLCPFNDDAAFADSDALAEDDPCPACGDIGRAGNRGRPRRCPHAAPPHPAAVLTGGA